MNEKTEDSQKAMALIKFFSKEEHYLAFKNGDSFFRTPHYYRTCEDRGRGDKNESCIVFWDRDLGDQLPRIVKEDGSELDLTDVKNLMLYPAHEQEDSWLQSWCMVGPFNEFELSLHKMIEEFGPYFVVLPAQNISGYAGLIRKNHNIKVRYGAVQYSDNPLERSLTVKDSNYSYQKEFRFYVGDCEKGEVRDTKLHLPGLSDLLLEANSLRLTSPAGEIRYFSQGGAGVIGSIGTRA